MCEYNYFCSFLFLYLIQCTYYICPFPLFASVLIKSILIFVCFQDSGPPDHTNPFWHTSYNCFKETAKKQVYFLNICYLIEFLAYFTIPYFNTKY